MLTQHAQIEARLGVPLQTLIDFCQRHHIAELSVFGSILRDDFKPTSDVDFLVTFASDARISLFDFVELEEQLEALLDRKVDLVSKRAIENSKNWIRQQNILGSAEVIYAER
jgi:predicted nucleotidyltransferase